MGLEEWIGVYKGLRLPLMGILLFILVYYYYKPSNKQKYEDIRFTMLDDDVDSGLADKFRKDLGEKESKSVASSKKTGKNN